MAGFLTDEWFAVLVELGTDLPEVPGANLVMQHVVSGSPHGKVQAAVEVTNGRVVVASAGKRADAGCTITWSYAHALAALRGELDLDVAFMRGDLKIDGDYAAFLFTLRPVFASEAGEKFLASVRARTDD